MLIPKGSNILQGLIMIQMKRVFPYPGRRILFGIVRKHVMTSNKLKKGAKMPKAKLTLNQKINQLNNQVEWFYGDDFSLDQATAKYQAATKLAKEIENDLEHLKNQITLIDKDFTKEV